MARTKRAPPARGPAPSYKGLAPASERASTAARGASRKTDTRCELKLRRALWSAGCRYRKDVADLPGRPDIVFIGARLVIFCDGDFWHGRDWNERRAKLARGANAPYWLAKIERNMERDRRHTASLEQRGWAVLRVWESDIYTDCGAVVREILAVLHERARHPRARAGASAQPLTRTRGGA